MITYTYSFSVLYFLSFSGASSNIFGSCLHSQLQITVCYCNRISSFSSFYFLQFRICFSGFRYSSVVLSQVHCILYYFVACKHLVYFLYSFAMFNKAANNSRPLDNCPVNLTF